MMSVIFKIGSILGFLLLPICIYLLVKKPNTPESIAMSPVAAAFANPDSIEQPLVAYINGDSVMAQYKYFKEMQATLENSFRSSNSKVQSEIEAANAEARELQEYGEKQGEKLTEADARAIEEKIMELNYKIQSLQEVEKNKLMEKENSLNLELMKRIRAYLDRYCAAHGIDMVFNYMDLNQGLLYGNGAFDITRNVVDGLNMEYDEEKNNQKK